MSFSKISSQSLTLQVKVFSVSAFVNSGCLKVDCTYCWDLLLLVDTFNKCTNICNSVSSTKSKYTMFFL